MGVENMAGKQASPPRFITLEGGEGAGKSTQARRLVDGLKATGLDPLLTREPGGSPGAEQIRALLVEGAAGRWDPLTETLLHFAARRDHLTKTIRPALAAGRWVVCDRFADSTRAYQGFGLGLDREVIEMLYRQVVGDDAPDLTLILDLPVEEGLRRTATRTHAETRYERMNEAFHQRLREGFLTLAREDPRRCVVIDASRDVDAVQSAIRAAVRERLGIGIS